MIVEHLRSQGDGVRAVCQVPGNLPLIIDDPEEVLTEEVGAADVVISLGIHQDVLAGLPRLMAERGGRALIGAIDDPGWIKPGLLNQVARACQERGIECIFPKPLCVLEPQTPVLGRFCEEYRIGKPRFRFVVEDGVIVEVEAARGSPCGLTEWVAEQLVGEPADESVVERAKVLHHTRPCLASMALDPIHAETVMHLSVDLIKYAAVEALRHAEER